MAMLPTTVPAAAADASCELQSYIRSSGDDYERLLLAAYLLVATALRLRGV